MGLESWVASANVSHTDFPLANLPYGVFTHLHSTRIGVAIGDQILDLRLCASEGLFAELPDDVVDACTANVLNPLMALGVKKWRALRARITELLAANADVATRRRVAEMLVPQSYAEMRLPAVIGGYTDFYASLHHATRVGKLFRPDNPLLPNYKYVPIGYHGRASSIVVSGTDVRRPSGQTKPPQAAEPAFGPSRSVDYELEMGIFIGPGNELGQTLLMGEAEQHVFGLCLVNDWSARDVQAWEYQPLGPFLAKNFATTISPWVVTMEALAPYRVAMAERAADDPKPLEYLSSGTAQRDAVDVTLEVCLRTRQMREEKMDAVRVSRGNVRDLYWSIAQLVTHHASNGCNLRTGDLLATGTISGADEGSEGCLLEMKHRGEPLRMPTGETRTFLEDGDEVTLRAYAERDGARIGFGVCAGMVVGG